MRIKKVPHNLLKKNPALGDTEFINVCRLKHRYKKLEQHIHSVKKLFSKKYESGLDIIQRMMFEAVLY